MPIVGLSVLTKALELVSGPLLGTIEDIARSSKLKQLAGGADLGGSLLLAAFEEDPFTAGLAVVASTAVIAMIGPEVFATAGAYSVISTVVRTVATRVLGSAVSEESMGALSTQIAKGLASTSVAETYERSVNFANKAFSLLGGSVNVPTAIDLNSFGEGSSVNFVSGVGFITSVQNPGGSFQNAFISSPPLTTSDSTDGTLTIKQLNLAAQVVLNPGSWNNVSFNDSKFSITLRNKNVSQGNGTGR